MRIMLVDDEELAIESLKEALYEVEPNADIAAFSKSKEAFDYLSSHKVDIAFLDIEMGELSGLALAEKCKALCPAVNIIFVTGYSQYTMDALKLRVSGYLMKPVRTSDLRLELKNLRHPLPEFNRRVRIQTFGNFEVFVDGKPLKFPRKKCKECLAYLVDRKGACVTYAQIASVLWEDIPISRAVQNNTYRIISDLAKVLKNAHAENILLRRGTDIGIDVKMVDCDYYCAIDGNTAWMNAFTGEYMTNYSWAEFTLGELLEIKRRNTQAGSGT